MPRFHAQGQQACLRRLRVGLDVCIGGRLQLRERLDASGTRLREQATLYGMPEAWLSTVVAYSRRLPAAGFLAETLNALCSPTCTAATTPPDVPP